jgi:hypothetical protein
MNTLIDESPVPPSCLRTRPDRALPVITCVTFSGSDLPVQ